MDARRSLKDQSARRVAVVGLAGTSRAVDGLRRAGIVASDCEAKGRHSQTSDKLQT